MILILKKFMEKDFEKKMLSIDRLKKPQTNHIKWNNLNIINSISSSKYDDNTSWSRYFRPNKKKYALLWMKEE